VSHPAKTVFEIIENMATADKSFKLKFINKTLTY